MNPPPEPAGPDPGSPAAYGKRMQYWLRDLIANPYTFLPDHSELYKTLLEHAEALTPLQALAMSMLLGGDGTRGYPDMPDTAELEFPGVNAFQATSQYGWYYYAGTLTGADGVDYGVLCMFYNNALLPTGLAHHFGLSDLQNQIVDVQLAISVGGGGKYYQADPVVAVGTSDVIRTSDALCLAVERGSAESLEKGSVFPLRVQAHGVDLAGAVPVPIAVDLVFSGGRSYLLQGYDGAEPLVGGIGTRYYSIPGLALDPKASSITIGGERIAAAKGTFWMDHQWGTGGGSRHEALRAASLENTSVPGWDFFWMNFDGPYSMTLNSLHTTANLPFINQTGPTPPPKMTAAVVGKYMDPFGTAFNVSGQLTVTDWRKTDHSPNPAKYANPGTWVPHGWSFALEEKVVPERLRSFTAVPLNDTAQALFFASGHQYVEAPTRLLDAEGHMVGTGFSEAVGYPDNVPNILTLAGVPVTPEILALIAKSNLITPEMKIAAYFYLLIKAHKDELDRLVACGSFPATARPANCGC